MTGNIDHVAYALKPFHYCFLISTTGAALRSRDIFVISIWYCLYLFVLCAASTSFVIHILFILSDMIISPFNMNSLCIYYWILQFAIVIYPLVHTKKQRIRKVLRAMEELDFKLRYKNFSLSKRNRINNIIWIAISSVYHVGIHVAVLYVMLDFGTDVSIIILTSWFKFLEISVDLELMCEASFALLLNNRSEFFASCLTDIIEGKIEETDLNLLLCHRQLHYVLKKINKAYKLQNTIISCFVTILTLRNLFLILHYPDNTFMVSAGILLVSRYSLLLILMGGVGQRVANTFDNIQLLALTMRDSSHIKKELVRSGEHMSVEGELRVRRLCGINGLQVDAKLPLKFLSVVGSALVFIMQMGFDTKSI